MAAFVNTSSISEKPSAEIADIPPSQIALLPPMKHRGELPLSIHQKRQGKCNWSSCKRSWNRVNVEEEEGGGIVVEEIAEAQRQSQVFLGL